MPHIDKDGAVMFCKVSCNLLEASKEKWKQVNNKYTCMCRTTDSILQYVRNFRLLYFQFQVGRKGSNQYLLKTSKKSGDK